NEHEHRGQDRDDERHDVEYAEGDLREDLVDDLEDRVHDQRADPADVGDGVEAGDHHAGAESDARHGSRDAGAATEVEDRVANEARRRAYDEQHAHHPQKNLQRQGVPLCHYLPSSISTAVGFVFCERAAVQVQLIDDCTQLATTFHAKTCVPLSHTA